MLMAVSFENFWKLTMKSIVIRISIMQVQPNSPGLFQVYIFGPLLASIVGGLLYEFIFSPHYVKKVDRPVVYVNNNKEAVVTE